MSDYVVTQFHRSRRKTDDSRMRLINTSTLKLEEFAESSTPAYAILSHRWGEGEITFEDLNSSRDVCSKRGFAKLKGFCRVLRSEGYDYGWIDTCCINKQSSLELGTAINSMYRWYSYAIFCIAYLEDVGPGRKSLGESEWFDRGWTLQELIAPQNLSFYDHDWLCLGTKSDHLTLLEETTKIPEGVLSHTSRPASYSIAQRMSWAANRITERVEDRAYSLMGLFNVNMDMIYGEKEQAFIRLQHQIMQHSADQSIFVWSLRRDDHPSGYSGLLAPSPSAFSTCSDIVPTVTLRAFGLSNLGLSISLPTYPYVMDTYLAFLECTNGGQPDSRYAIFLARLSEKDQYARVLNSKDQSKMIFSDVPQLPLPSMVVRQVYVRQELAEAPSTKTHGFWLRHLEPPSSQTCQIGVLSRTPSSEADRILLAPEDVGLAGIVSIKTVEKRPRNWIGLRWISFGFDHEFNPLIMLANDKPHPRTTAIGIPAAEDFEEAVKSGPYSDAHKSLFEDDGWLTLKPDSVPPREWRKWAGPFYIIRVNRHSGGTYKFDYLSLRIDVGLVPDPKLRGEHGPEPSRSQMIWTVHVTDLGEDKTAFESNWYSFLWDSDPSAFQKLAPFRDGFGRPVSWAGQCADLAANMGL